MPYLKEKGVLETIIQSPSILALTLEEIKRREKYIEQVGGTILNPDGKRFNSIFGWSRKKFNKEAERTLKADTKKRPTNEEFEDKAGEAILAAAIKDSLGIGEELTESNIKKEEEEEEIDD